MFLLFVDLLRIIKPALQEKINNSNLQPAIQINALILKLKYRTNQRHITNGPITEQMTPI